MNYQDRAMSSESDDRKLAGRAATAERSKKLALTAEGGNFFTADGNIATVLPQYMDAPLLAHLTPHLTELGDLCGGRLAELSNSAEANPPKLVNRDRFGRDEVIVDAARAEHETLHLIAIRRRHRIVEHRNERARRQILELGRRGWHAQQRLGLHEHERAQRLHEPLALGGGLGRMAVQSARRDRSSVCGPASSSASR